ncbi:MAG TPA: kelch repeat-containing protein [Candidatus Limnocylindrales bacterium]
MAPTTQLAAAQSSVAGQMSATVSMAPSTQLAASTPLADVTQLAGVTEMGRTDSAPDEAAAEATPVRLFQSTQMPPPTPLPSGTSLSDTSAPAGTATPTAPLITMADGPERRTVLPAEAHAAAAARAAAGAQRSPHSVEVPRTRMSQPAGRPTPTRSSGDRTRATRPDSQVIRSASGVRGGSYRGAQPPSPPRFSPQPPLPMQPGVTPELWRTWNRPASRKHKTNWGAWIVIAIVAFVVIGAIGNASKDRGYVAPDIAAYPTYGNFEPAAFPHYDPLVAVGSLAQDRAGHTATLLDDGRVLIAGGYSADGTAAHAALDGVEIYDPASMGFQAGGLLVTARYDAVAARLPDGTVLIAGGNDASGVATDSAEIYDPKSGISVSTGRMAEPVASAAVVTLDDGRILIAGGVNDYESLFGAQIYDPATKTFSSIDATFYGQVTATKMRDGRVLVSGGRSSGDPSISARIFDPSGEDFSWIDSMSVGREGAMSGLLPDGRVIVVGGMGSGGSVNHTADIYDPKLQRFVSEEELADYRYRGTMTILGDGSVLLVGGVDQYGTPLASVELDFPDEAPSAIGSMSVGRADQTATLLNDGTVLIVGGVSSSGATTSTVGVYAPKGIQLAVPSGSPGASGSPAAGGSSGASGSPAVGGSPGASGSPAAGGSSGASGSPGALPSGSPLPSAGISPSAVASA